MMAGCGGVVAVRAGAGRVREATSAIRTALAEQGAALQRGDRTGWLRPVDPALQPELLRLYGNLRGFHVSAWLPRTTSMTGDHGSWQAAVQIRVCFADTRCTRDAETYVPLGDVITAATVWRVTDGRAALTTFTFANGTPIAVPWKTGELSFAEGSRVVVAASAGGPAPSSWIAAADRAALAADRYAIARPGKYLIYLAAEDEWAAAIGADEDALGFVDRTSKQTAFTVVDAAEAPDEHLLKHELGHVSTLLGTLGGDADWAIEGMAEYVAWEQTPMAAYRRKAAARALAGRTGWQGRLDLPWSPAPADRVGYYAMAYLAVRCLASAYGKEQLLSFFTGVARNGRAPADVALTTLGVPWATAEATCHPKIDGWLR
ncbi:hypothetical protein L083_1239 [Actinoplanes sp. N902-109]|nr:hypothetical protein L083_1239 [Actinoplanes sp. N902-109]